MSGFDWHGYLWLAEELPSRAPNDPRAATVEASHRTTISRAYYAAFGLARAHLRGKGIAISTRGSAHDAVWTAFHDVGDKTHRRIANRGRVLKRLRAWADYDPTIPFSATDAVDAVRLARRLVFDLDSLT